MAAYLLRKAYLSLYRMTDLLKKLKTTEALTGKFTKVFFLSCVNDVQCGQITLKFTSHQKCIPPPFSANRRINS